MKARIQTLSKKELAQRLKISSDTLVAWIAPIRHILERYGYHKNMKLLTPKIVEIILDFLDAKDNLVDEQETETGKPQAMPGKHR